MVEVKSIEKMNMTDLKNALKARNLSNTGKKGDLVARITQFQNDVRQRKRNGPRVDATKYTFFVLVQGKQKSVLCEVNSDNTIEQCLELVLESVRLDPTEHLWAYKLFGSKNLSKTTKLEDAELVVGDVFHITYDFGSETPLTAMVQSIE
jgi:hypothetical protein